MKYYQEITLIRNADIDPCFILSKVFQQIHLGLVEIQDGQRRVPIGVSFPEYKRDEKSNMLGSNLRLFAPNKADLVRFDVHKWLTRLSDYVHCTHIQLVPSAIKGYSVYQRNQPKLGRERLARRYAKRHNVDYETALNGRIELSSEPEAGMKPRKILMSYSEMPPKTIAEPFIRLESLSNGNIFPLWIKKSEMKNSSSGTFSTYGLSSTSTVPEF